MIYKNITEGDMSHLGERVKSLREDRDLSQRELGEAIGVRQSTISEIERGSNNPSWSTLQSLAKFFDVQISFLLGEEVQAA